MTPACSGSTSGCIPWPRLNTCPGPSPKLANTLDPEMPERSANVATLNRRLACPCLGLIPRLATPEADALAGYLRLPDAH